VGEELTIAYVDIGASTFRRRAMLRTGYFFECQCKRCAGSPDCTLSDLYLEEVRCNACTLSDSSVSGATSHVEVGSSAGVAGRCEGVMQVVVSDDSAVVPDNKVPLDAVAPQSVAVSARTSERICKYRMLGEYESAAKYQCSKCSVLRDRQEMSAPLQRRSDGIDLLEQASSRVKRVAIASLESRALKELCAILLQAHEQLSSVVDPHCSHLRRVQDLLAQAYTALSDWSQSARFCAESIIGFEVAYPPAHPLPALQLLMLGKLQLHLDQPSQAMESLRRSESILKLTHGDTHELYLQLRNLLDQALAEQQQQLLRQR